MSTANRVKTVQIKEDITSRNNAQAQSLRDSLRQKKIFYLKILTYKKVSMVY